jgi:L-fucose isomerase-like protein
VVKGLRNLRIGAIGARPTAFNTVRYSEKLLEASGISVETLDLSEVLGRIGRMKDTDESAVAKLKSIEKYVSTSGIPQAALLKMPIKSAADTPCASLMVRRMPFRKVPTFFLEGLVSSFPL